MWIALGILLFLAIIIIAILMLPILVIIKTDENNELIFRYKLLNKVYGENPDPNNPIFKILTQSAGISRLKYNNLQTSFKKRGAANTIREILRIVFDLIKEVLGILKFCKAKKFDLDIVVRGEDAAETAIEYGECCAVAYPLLGAVFANVKINLKVPKVNIACDYDSKDKTTFKCDIVLSVRLVRVLVAFFRIAFMEAKRTINDMRAQYPQNVKKDTKKP